MAISNGNFAVNRNGGLNSMTRLLLADDDQVLSDLLSEYLRSQDLTVTQVMNGRAAVEAVTEASGSTEEIDLVVLDVMMPELDGFGALREIRAFSEVPVLMLTARGEDVDRIVGLEMGADDYLPKPCNPRELLARVRAILRRVDISGQGNFPEALEIDDLVLRSSDRTVQLSGKPVELTTAEFNMLEALMRNAGSIVSKEDLTEKGLARKLELYDRSVDMHISNLRKKLGQKPNTQQRIKTVRGIGYLYAVDTSQRDG